MQQIYNLLIYLEGDNVPERNILQVGQSYDLDPITFSYIYYYYANIYVETARAFNLDKKGNDFINGRINSTLDYDGNIIHIINEPHNFQVFSYNSKYTGEIYAIKFPDEFVKDYGIRKDDYIDIVFESIIQGKTKQKIPIFPKVLKNGELRITPKDIKHKKITNIDILIDYKANDEYYNDLIMEINYANAYGLYRSTMVLTRILIENILIDILRFRYGTKDIDLFYNKSKNQHNDLSILLGNIKKRIADFKPFIQSFDEHFLDDIDKLRTHSNASAHTLELNIEQQTVNKSKEKIRNICRLLFTMRDKLIQLNPSNITSMP